MFNTHPFGRPLTRAAFARLDLLIALSLALIVVLLLSFAPAHAGNTIFLTDKSGQLSFPLSPPNRATGAPGAIDNMAIGQTTPAVGKFSQVQPGGAVPTIASGACGTGTNGAVVAGSTPMAGQITIGASATTVCTIVFSPALAVAPKACTFFPMNAAAGATGTTVAFASAPTTGGIVLNGAALANANYGYHCF